MNLAGLKEAIIARVQADATIPGGLWVTGARLINSITYTYGGRLASSGVAAPAPSLVFDFPAMEQRDGFYHDLEEIYFRFHLWYPFLRDKDTAITRAGTILDRLYGNALARANRTPDYGFHRHILNLTTTGDPLTPWHGGLCYRISCNEAHEETSLHFIETYRTSMSRVLAAS